MAVDAPITFAQIDTLEMIKKVGRLAPASINGNVVKALLRRELVEYDEANYLVLTAAGRKEASR